MGMSANDTTREWDMTRQIPLGLVLPPFLLPYSGPLKLRNIRMPSYLYHSFSFLIRY